MPHDTSYYAEYFDQEQYEYLHHVTAIHAIVKIQLMLLG